MQRQNKKPSIQSVEDQAELLQDILAAQPIEPPDHVTLTTSELPFFYDIVEEFTRTDWTAHQLSLAALLAREMYGLEKEQRTLRKEGSIITSGKGWKQVNPRRTVVQQHANAILAFRRSLALHARAAGNSLAGMAKDLDRRKGLERGAHALYGDDDILENEELLPRNLN